MPQNIEHCNYSLAYLPCCLQIVQTQAGIAPSETEESCLIASSFTKHGLHTKWHQPFLVYLSNFAVYMLPISIRYYCCLRNRYSPSSIRVELRSWSLYGTLFTSLDKYMVFFHTSNCKSVSLPYSYCARTIVDKQRRSKSIHSVCFGVKC